MEEGIGKHQKNTLISLKVERRSFRKESHVLKESFLKSQNLTMGINAHVMVFTFKKELGKLCW